MAAVWISEGCCGSMSVSRGWPAVAYSAWLSRPIAASRELIGCFASTAISADLSRRCLFPRKSVPTNVGGYEVVGKKLMKELLLAVRDGGQDGGAGPLVIQISRRDPRQGRNDLVIVQLAQR